MARLPSVPLPIGHDAAGLLVGNGLAAFFLLTDGQTRVTLYLTVGTGGHYMPRMTLSKIEGKRRAALDSLTWLEKQVKSDTADGVGRMIALATVTRNLADLQMAQEQRRRETSFDAG